MWYEEAKNYNWNKSSEFSISEIMQMHTGHFTQLVWRNSKQFGFGVAITPNGSYIAVANYYPAGNVIKHFKENVFESNTFSKIEFEKSKTFKSKLNSS